MFNIIDLVDLSLKLDFSLYLYDKNDVTVTQYFSSRTKNITVPPLFTDMVKKRLKRVVTEKNNVKSIYRQLIIDDTYSIFFQDSLDENRLDLLFNTIIQKNNMSISDTVTSPTSETDTSLSTKSQFKDDTRSELKSTIEILTKEITSLKQSNHEHEDNIASINEKNEEYILLIKKLKSSSDQLNINKLQDINKSLREELSKSNYYLNIAEDMAQKLKKSTTAALVVSNNLLTLPNIKFSDIQPLINILALKESLATYNQSKANIAKNIIDIHKIIDTLNMASENNSTDGIDIEKLSSVIAIKDIDIFKKNPARELKNIVGTLIGMEKSKKINYKNILILYKALNIKYD